MTVSILPHGALLLITTILRGCHGNMPAIIADARQSQPSTPSGSSAGSRGEGMSLVLDPAAAGGVNFIRLLQKPALISQHDVLQVEYMCDFSGFAALDIRVWSGLHKDHVVFSHTWSCSPHVMTSLRKHVRVLLPSEYAYAPSVLNARAEAPQKVLVQVYLLEDSKFKKKKLHSRYGASLVNSQYRVKLLAPLSRETKPLGPLCLTWWTKVQLSLPYRPQCPQEPVEVKLLSFPMALSQGKNGVHRAMSKHKNEALEKQRLQARTDVKFTLVLWLYVEEWCSFRLCSLFHHLTWDEVYQTPLIFMNAKGNLHVQIATSDDSRPMAFLTNDFHVPLRHWFRLAIRCKNQKFEVHALHGANLEKKFSTWYKFGAMDTVYFDQAVGVFTVGGSEMNKAFKGLVGEASFYRDYVDLNNMRLPGPHHPMHELGLEERERMCDNFTSWVKYRIHQCEGFRKRRKLKRSCSYTLEDIFHVSLKRNLTFSIPQCTQEYGPSLAHYTHVNRLVKRWVLAGRHVTLYDVATQLYDDAKELIEEKGLDKTRSIIPLLRQASCHGNHDASFMLATILCKGVSVRADEMQGISYLIAGALANHRLCLMSLGNKHTHGLDGAPRDLEMAYAYYKYVGDMTKGDREKHSENDVFTEHVRLTDEQALSDQTGEEGDLFLWFKHQAQQGEVHAMQNLGRLLFWGTQGVHRDLAQAAEFYRMGALNGDPQSMHDYGLVLLKGQGVEKNETHAKTWLHKAAKLGHVNAHNALGWFALEKDSNYTLALQYFMYAHERGNPDAAYNIGHMLQFGRLENKTVDKVNAYPYFFDGAARGQLDAALMVAQTHQRGHPLVARNPFTSLDWARHVAEQNPAVGRILHKGLKAYTSENWPAALLYYIMAAESGVEVGHFNLAYLCEENVEGVVTQLQKECVYTNFNLSTKRYPHQIDPYAWIRMGDYYWHGVGGEGRDVAKAAEAYCAAALRWDPHVRASSIDRAMYNLGFMIEEGAEIPTSVWYRLNIPPEVYHHNASLLAELYYRCSDSYKSEAYIPCVLSLYRVQLTDIWLRYHILIQILVVILVLFASAYSIPTVHQYLHANRAILEPTEV